MRAETEAAARARTRCDHNRVIIHHHHQRMMTARVTCDTRRSILAAPVTELTHIVCRLVSNIACAADAAAAFVDEGVIELLSCIITAAQWAAGV